MKEGIRIIIECKSKKDSDRIEDALKSLFQYGRDINDNVSYSIKEIKEHLKSSSSYFKK